MKTEKQVRQLQQEKAELENELERVKSLVKYKIVRMRFKGTNRVIKRGLTLEQAQAHCQDPATSGDGWFDGYEAE